METPEMQTILQEHDSRLRELEDAIKQIAVIAEMAGRHEKILKGGDRADDIGLQELVRNIDRNQCSAAYWAKALAMIFLAQFVAVIVSGIVMFLKILPVLLSLANATPIP